MRAGTLNKLTAKQVRAAEDGRYSDGGGLYLQVRNGKRSWIFRYTPKGTGKKREMGLGSDGSVPLAQARQLATEARLLVAEGKDPLDVRLAEESAPQAPVRKTLMTFREATDEFLRGYGPTLSNPKHRKQWDSTLTTYADALMPMAVADISAADIHDCLDSIWLTKMETASRVRQRIEKVIAFADAREDRDRGNPADMKRKLGFLLPSQKKLKVVRHHAALDPAELPACFATAWARRDGSIGFRALVTLILTVLRSGEVRFLEWSDIEKDKIVVPAYRMKARRAHRVPMTPVLRQHLASVPRFGDSPLVHPGQSVGRAMSDMTISKCLKVAGYGQATPHGMRSTFSDWANAEGFSRDLIEDQLAHILGSDVERAYRRSDFLERRRPMMLSWERFVTSSIENVEAAE